MIPIALLKKQVEQHQYPLIFATISGAHLYGFPSPDSDFDLRGVHVLPLKEVVGLRTGPETIERSGVHDGLESEAEEEIHSPGDGKLIHCRIRGWVR